MINLKKYIKNIKTKIIEFLILSLHDSPENLIKIEGDAIEIYKKQRSSQNKYIFCF